jgi:hypothetical protein
MMTRGVELGQLYTAARRDLVMRQWLGVAPDWDRPEWLPADFGELEVAGIADSWRQAWAIEFPARADGVVPEPPEGADGWNWIGFDWDVDAMKERIDADIETSACAMAHRLGLLDNEEGDR